VIASNTNDPSAGEYSPPEAAKGQLDFRLTLFLVLPIEMVVELISEDGSGRLTSKVHRQSFLVFVVLNACIVIWVSLSIPRENYI